MVALRERSRLRYAPGGPAVTAIVSTTREAMQGEPSRSAKHSWLAGAVCLLALQILVVATRYELRDPDSTLYAAIANDLSKQPLRSWIAPTWPEGRGAGLFTEHPAVFFWPSAALLRGGLEKAPLFVNFVCWLLTLHFLYALARSLAGEVAATFAVACCAVSPLLIQYLLRANQETALALGCTGAFAALADPRIANRSLRIVVFVALAFAAKGVLGGLVLLALVLFALWRKDRGALRSLALAAATSVVLAAGYELLFRRISGSSFLLSYLEAQASEIAAEVQGGWLRALGSPPYYLAHWFWLALPSSALGLAAIFRRLPPTEARTLGIATTGSYLAVLSFFARRAARYAFPACVVCHVSGGEEVARFAPLRALVLRHRTLLPYALMAWLFVVAAVRTWFDARYFQFVNPF
jgi:4-amino-4-deoxy-L-arabinose transferase-like glycosyltransferase